MSSIKKPVIKAPIDNVVKRAKDNNTAKINRLEYKQYNNAGRIENAEVPGSSAKDCDLKKLIPSSNLTYALSQNKPVK